jgi:hypothetical protein
MAGGVAAVKALPQREKSVTNRVASRWKRNQSSCLVHPVGTKISQTVRAQFINLTAT